MFCKSSQRKMYWSYAKVLLRFQEMNLTSESISYKKTQNFRKMITDKVPRNFGSYKVTFLSHF